MNNTTVSNLLLDVQQEIADLKEIIHEQGAFHKTTPYLTRYSLIKATGTLEVAFKSIIADSCMTTHPQVDFFIEKKVRKNSMNPSYDNICRLLKEFDKEWADKLKLYLNQDPLNSRIKSSLESLNSARNEFAHGGNPSASIDAIESYYIEGMKIISIVDCVVI